MPRESVIEVKEFRHFHFCCGLGGAKKGFNQARPHVGNLTVKTACHHSFSQQLEAAHLRHAHRLP